MIPRRFVPPVSPRTAARGWPATTAIIAALVAVLELLVGTVTAVPGLRVFASYMSWSPYPGNDLAIDSLDWPNIDTLLYGPVGFAPNNGSLELNDPYSNEDMVIDPEDAYCSCCVRGGIGRLWALKKQYPHVKTVLTMGPTRAWLAANRSAVALQMWTAATANQTFLAQQLVTYMNQRGLDGLHLQWPDLELTPSYAPSFLALATAVRQQMQASGRSGVTLSVHLPANATLLNNGPLNLTALNAVVDRVHVAVGNIRSTTNTFRHAQNALTSSSDPVTDPVLRMFTSVSGIVDFMTAAGIPASKLVTTLAFQGLVYYGVGAGGPGQTYAMSPDPLEYRPWMTANITSAAWTVNVDTNAGSATWYWNSANLNAVTMPTRTSIRAVLDAVLARSILGVETYHLAGDLPRTNTTSSLWPVVASYASVDTPTTARMTAARSACLSSSPFCNLRCNSDCYASRTRHFCTVDLTQPASNAAPRLAVTLNQGGPDVRVADAVQSAVISTLSTNSIPATLFIGTDRLTSAATLRAARRVADLPGGAVGLAWSDPLDTLLALSDTDFRAHVASAIVAVARSAGADGMWRPSRVPSLARIPALDEAAARGDPRADRLCRVLTGLGVQRVSWSLDTLDYTVASGADPVPVVQQAVNFTLANMRNVSMVVGMARSAIAVQMDGLVGEPAAVAAVQTLAQQNNVTLISASECLGVPATNAWSGGWAAAVVGSGGALAVPPGLAVNLTCPLDQVVTQCQSQTRDASLVLVRGPLSSMALYNLTENIRQRRPGMNPIVPLTVAVDTSELTATTTDALRRARAAYMARFLVNQGHTLAIHLPSTVSSANAAGYVYMAQQALQQVAGVRAKFIVPAGDTLDVEVCSMLAVNGVAILALPRLGAAWAEPSGTHVPEMDAVRGVLGVGSGAVLVSAQHVAALPAVPRTPNYDDFVGRWLWTLAQRNTDPITLASCLGSPTAVVSVPAVQACGDGICYTYGGEDCRTCPVDCGVCPANPVAPSTTNPFDVTSLSAITTGTDSSSTDTSGSTETSTSTAADAFLAFIASPAGIIVCLLTGAVLATVILRSVVGQARALVRGRTARARSASPESSRKGSGFGTLAPYGAKALLASARMSETGESIGAAAVNRRATTTVSAPDLGKSVGSGNGAMNESSATTAAFAANSAGSALDGSQVGLLSDTSAPTSPTHAVAGAMRSLPDLLVSIREEDVRRESTDETPGSAGAASIRTALNAVMAMQDTAAASARASVSAPSGADALEVPAGPVAGGSLDPVSDLMGELNELQTLTMGRSGRCS
ncbi:Endochitinase 1 [Allomyces arbusculus]|nr:Endochitinase 1 [Allomyces arbusculus]